MNRIINSLCHKIYPLFFKQINSKIKRNFLPFNTEIKIIKKELIFSNSFVLNNLIYKDESWNQIKYIGHYMWNNLFKINLLKQTNTKYFIDNDCTNTKVVVSSDKILCKSKNRTNDWIFLLFKEDIHVPYLVEFEAEIFSKSTEFQFAFNYKSIGERYRFNLLNNKQLNFEVVYGGFFHNQLISTPLSLHLNKLYNFKIAVTSDVFSYLIDDKIIMSVKQQNPIIDIAQFAFILWDSVNSNINVTYKNINIYKI